MTDGGLDVVEKEETTWGARRRLLRVRNDHPQRP